MRVPFTILSIIISLLLTGHAQTTFGAGPTETVKAGIEEVRNVFRNERLTEEGRNTILRRIAHERFDFAEMGKRTLPGRWDQLSPKNRREFISAFTALIEETYRKKIRRYEKEIRAHTNDRVVYLSEKVDGRLALVKTRILTLSGVSVPVDYRLIRKNGNWLMYDIIAERVSLVQNYRSQFSTICRQASFEELLRKLKEKTVQ